MSESKSSDQKDDVVSDCGSGSGSECPPHDPDLIGGDACFEWGGFLPGWNLIVNNCKPGYVYDAPHFNGTYVGECRRTECMLDTGSGSGS